MSIKKLTLGLFVCAALAAPALAETPAERQLHSFDYVQSVSNPTSAVKSDNYSTYRESGEKHTGKHHGHKHDGKHHHGHKHEGKKADAKKADGTAKPHHHHHHKKAAAKPAAAAPAAAQ